MHYANGWRKVEPKAQLLTLKGNSHCASLRTWVNFCENVGNFRENRKKGCRNGQNIMKIDENVTWTTHQILI